MVSLCSLSDLPFLPFLSRQGPLSPKHPLVHGHFYSTSILNHLVSETGTTGKVLWGGRFV